MSAKPGHEIGKYTTLHGSQRACAFCGENFEARILSGPNADRFCKTHCKDEFWNERRTQIKSPPTVAAEAGGMEQNKQPSAPKHTPIRPGTKLWSLGAALARGERLDCFLAAHKYHDFVLRSTISELSNRYGVDIERDEKTV